METEIKKKNGIFHNEQMHKYEAFKDGKWIGSIDDDRTRSDISLWKARVEEEIDDWSPYL